MLSKVCCVVSSAMLHANAGKQVAQTELARQRMRGCLQLGRVARAHLNWLFKQHSRQGSSLESAFVLACLNLTLTHSNCTASAVLHAFSLMPQSSYSLLSLGCLSRLQGFHFAYQGRVDLQPTPLYPCM